MKQSINELNQILLESNNSFVEWWSDWLSTHFYYILHSIHQMCLIFFTTIYILFGRLYAATFLFYFNYIRDENNEKWFWVADFKLILNNNYNEKRKKRVFMVTNLFLCS